LDASLTTRGTEVVIAILEQLSELKGKTRPRVEKYINVELLSRAPKRLH
jgi:hypothetical protein